MLLDVGRSLVIELGHNQRESCVDCLKLLFNGGIYGYIHGCQLLIVLLLSSVNPLIDFLLRRLDNLVNVSL